MESVPPPERLRSSADIRGVVSARHAWGEPHVVVHARRRGDVEGSARVAVVAGRRVGGAVVRNRAKRRLRACLAQCELPTGVDLVVTGKAGAETVAFERLQGEVTEGVRRAMHRTA